jgi:hypothetical protein
LKARICRVEERPAQLDELELEIAAFVWLVERNALALRGPSWVAFLAERADELDKTSASSVTKGISVKELRNRANNTRLVSLQLSDGEVEIDLNSPRLENVVRSSQLDAVERSFGPAATVQRARAMIGERQLTCDFSRSTGSVIGPTMITMSDLVGTGLPLLRPLTDDERRTLEELLDDEGPRQLKFDLDEPPPSPPAVEHLKEQVQRPARSGQKLRIEYRSPGEIESPSSEGR